MTRTAPAPPPVHWIEGVQSVEGIPGLLRRSGRYLYLHASSSSRITADGVVVDGVQLVRTDPARPTRLDVDGIGFEGVEEGAALGVRRVGAQF